MQMGVRRLGWMGGCGALALFAVLHGRAWSQGEEDLGQRSAQELREEFAELSERMAGSDPAKRRVGVKRLAELGTREAWQLVIAALADPEPEVADEAQLHLARLDDERLLDSVLDRGGLRGRDALVALRVAEAIGRMTGPLDGAPLVERAKRGDPALARTLVWSIERLAQRRALGGDPKSIGRELEKLALGRGEAEVRAAALLALGTVQGEGARLAILAALVEREPALRVAGLASLRHFVDEEAVAHARRLAADKERAVRQQAVLELERIGSRAVIETLIARLEAEERPRLRLRVLEALQHLSGLKHRYDVRPWRDWSARLPEDWVPARALRAEASGELAGATVAFAGLPILSDRVAFLMDFSGSLWNEREDGTTRKQVLDGHVRELLGGLSESIEFDLVPYTATPHPWQGRIVPARRRTVEEGLRWFEACQERGQGNVFDAVFAALADPRVDTLVILTDGAPTGGTRWSLDLMVPLLLEATRFRHIAFDSIVVDAPPRLVRHWQRLAQGSGGRSIAIRM